LNADPQNPLHPAASGRLDTRTTVIVFLAFAAAYFCSALVRAITATLSPVLTAEFSLQARDLGLLAGGYFFGFAAMQLPLGTWLDRHGPKKVILCFLSLSVAGCLAFSAATHFGWLLASRVLVGAGVSACLMAPLTGFRRWFDTATLLRANSWMLMTGSLGMLASTLPVQWLMPLTGWRPLFWILAALILLSMAVIAGVIPRWSQPDPAQDAPPFGTRRKVTQARLGEGQRVHEPPLKAEVQAVALPPEAIFIAASGPAENAVPDPSSQVPSRGYTDVWKSAYFRRMCPLAVFNYGGLLAIQTLWAGPWLARNGWPSDRVLAWGVPLSLLALAVNIAGGTSTGWPGWALFCMASSVMGLSQPAVGMAFPPALAGRALSAYNLMIFGGVFAVQWGIGLLIDAFAVAGLSQVAAFQAAMSVFLTLCTAAYAWFMARQGVTVDNLQPGHGR
jgi:MFS family permease